MVIIDESIGIFQLVGGMCLRLPMLMSTSSMHCPWEDETVKERTGCLPSYAESKRMRSLTLRTHGCPFMWDLPSSIVNSVDGYVSHCLM